MNTQDFFVSLLQVTESGWTEWVTDDTNVPGLCLADPSLEQLIKTCTAVIPELLVDNTGYRGEITIHFNIKEEQFVTDMVA